MSEEGGDGNNNNKNRSLRDMMRSGGDAGRTGGGNSTTSTSRRPGTTSSGGSRSERSKEGDDNDDRRRSRRRPPRATSSAGHHSTSGSGSGSGSHVGDDRTVASAASSGSGEREREREGGGASSSSRSSRQHHHSNSRSSGDDRSMASHGSSSARAASSSSNNNNKQSSRSGGDRDHKSSASSSSSRRGGGGGGGGPTSGDRKQSSRSLLSKSKPSSSRDTDSHYTSDDEHENDIEEEPSSQDLFATASLFGDAGTFGSADAFGGSGSGSGGGNGDGFGAFPADFGSFPITATSTTNTKTTGIASDDSSNFNTFASFATTSNTSTSTAAAAAAASTSTAPIVNPPVPKVLFPNNNSIQFQDPPRPLLVQKSPPTAVPKANPLTGNVICCRLAPSFNNNNKNNNNNQGGKNWQLVEWNPTTQAQVMSAPLFSQDLQRKIAQKYKVTATAVDTVLCLTVGVHQAGGYTRPRVATLMDVLVTNDEVTSTSTNSGEKKREVLRIIAVWQWGYGSSSQSHHPKTTMIQLQSLLSPPSGSDFTYNPTSLLVADSCVFVSGASSKGPCVFLSKPTVKETWSANFVGKEAARIAHMAVTTCSVINMEQPKSNNNNNNNNNNSGAVGPPAQAPRLPYLAIALTDGALSIWTYEAATKVSNKNNTSDTAVRRLLYPLCKLEATKLFRNVAPTDWENNTTTDAANKEVGYCTHLEWVSPRVSAHNQLLLLAAAFQGGVCLYHVGLPKVLDKTSASKKGSSYVAIPPPSEKTQLSQTCSLKPYGMVRWPAVYHYSHVSFCDLGPHLPPSLCVLVTGLQTNLDYARAALVTCQLPMYGIKSKKNSGSDTVATTVWHSKEFARASPQLPRGLIPGSFSGGVLYYSDTHLQLLELTQPMYASTTISKKQQQQQQQYSSASTTRLMIRGGIGSLAAGLTTVASNHYSDCTNTKGSPYKDGIWHVYTTLQCERQKTDEYLEWGTPMRRHWLIQTMIGDCKEASAVSLSLGSEGDVVSGGTTSKVVCELGGLGPLSKMVPFRLVRHDGVAAVLFRSSSASTGTEEKFSVAIVDKEDGGGGSDETDESNKKSSIVQVLDGRDAVFLPNTKPLQLLLLHKNGGSVALWERKGGQGTPWIESRKASYRPIIGVNDASAKDYVDCQRLISVTFQDQVGLIAVGYKACTDTSCLVAGKLEASEGLDWSKILPNVQTDSVLWLNENEQVSTVLCLPPEQGLQGGIAVATSQRIMILSPTLTILSSVSIRVSPSSLVPMGSYTVAYASHEDYKIRYLSGLSFGALGLIASFPSPQYDYNPHFILAIRPDRIIYTSWHTGIRLVERGQDSHVFLMPTAVTRPALLLEPMIANAIATGGSQTGLQPFFRTIVEKFGRKVATMTHGEGEGIGNHGAGMTPRVFELLQHYNLKAAASWLLTGTTRFDRSANSRLLPSWMPISAKVKAAVDSDTHLHVIANGDQYFSEYIKSPDHNMTATLPRPSDPSSFTCQYFATEALRQGNSLDAFKLLDLVGTESSDAMLLQLALAIQMDPSKDITPLLNSLFQADSQMAKGSSSNSIASLAALAAELKKGGAAAEDDFTKQWMRPLAPSIQRGRKIGRIRPRIIGESVFHVIGKAEPFDDRLFSSETNESKLVWNEGPNREKENLLMLDHIQEWFGRRRPVILGKEGAKSAEDRGASTLADILAAPDDDSFGGDDDEDGGVEAGWADGVGEGMKDEDKLSAYYRFSEGEDEDNSWREEGFVDLSKFEVKATLVGCNDTAVVQKSQSNVDEGDEGKVRPIYDIVFEQSGVGQANALAIPAVRGGSLDVGMMHGPDHTSRQKCTVEFWFWVPETVKKEIILARRTFGSSADDLDNVCKASNKESALWELAMSSKGEIEFRTISGGSIKSSPKPASDDDGGGPQSTLSFGKWNHVCVTIRQESVTTSAVNVLVKGNSIGNKSLNLKPPNFEEDDFAGASGLDSLLEKSYLVFALDHPATFRMTELRVWATERDDDDIRTMMTEYLEPAEVKRKFRVKIKKKTGGEGGGAKIGLAALPKGKLTPKGALAAPGGFAPPKLGLAPPKGALTPPKGSLAPPEEGERPARKGFLAPPKGSDDGEKRVSPKGDDMGGFGGFGAAEPAAATTPTGFGGDAFGGSFGAVPEATTSSSPTAAFGTGFGVTAGGGGAFQQQPEEVDDEEDDDGEIEISPLWDSAIPLSEQVRSSAAAALIRGPPATRHFGGNRGGLPDYRELERLGVGAISICGSEKTIVWRDDQVPPGLTYPIGASGAIVSDQMDEDGSEFLCCFLAKDKRMVVFELSTRTVVVELQMTTKLNFWRFLPPEAGEDTLCFMLVTPVGGFHWMPLDESPRPRQVWKRGPELQSKKIVCYEEGGTNGLDGPDMLSKVGMLLVTNAATGGRLEAWMIPICGDSEGVCASDDVLGACLCRPPDVGFEAWMPLLLFVVESEEGDWVVCVSAVTETSETSVGLTEVMTDALIEHAPYEGINYDAPSLAMGTWPEVLCCSLGSTIVIIVRSKGLVVAYELADTGLELIAQEHVGHYVVDAVMRYSAVEGGAEIVLLMSDEDNPRDGRVGTFCFRTAG